jgi:hypothetical protein
VLWSHWQCVSHAAPHKLAVLYWLFLVICCPGIRHVWERKEAISNTNSCVCVCVCTRALFFFFFLLSSIGCPVPSCHSPGGACEYFSKPPLGAAEIWNWDIQHVKQECSPLHPHSVLICASPTFLSTVFLAGLFQFILCYVVYVVYYTGIAFIALDRLLRMLLIIHIL